MSPADPRMDLSPRQRDVLDFISMTIAQRQIPPTYREIGDALDITSTNGVADHVKALIRKGFLRKVEGSGDNPSGVARGLQLTEKAGSKRRGAVVSVPLVGNIAAGQPILAEENYERTLHIDRGLVPDGGVLFALRVRGESMIEEGIHDGDFVIVRQQEMARNGDIVVAIIDGEATVKHYFREAKRIRLQPANKDMDPIFVNAAHTTLVQGVVVGVYRSYH
jgi:repressor LexA